MTTTLYHAPSTAALVVHWLLIELDVPHVLHPLDFERAEQKSPAYLALNPAGVVPTLVLDGQVLTEAAAIVLHLADLHPQAGLAPPPGTPARAAYYRWMFFCANTLQPAYRAWFYRTSRPAPRMPMPCRSRHAPGSKRPGPRSTRTCRPMVRICWARPCPRPISC